MPTPQLYTVYIKDKKYGHGMKLTLNEAVDSVKDLVKKLTLTLKLRTEVDQTYNERVQAEIRSIRIVPE